MENKPLNPLPGRGGVGRILDELARRRAERGIEGLNRRFKSAGDRLKSADTAAKEKLEQQTEAAQDMASEALRLPPPPAPPILPPGPPPPPATFAGADGKAFLKTMPDKKAAKKGR